MSPLPRALRLLSRATLADGRVVDVLIDDARVVSVHPAGTLQVATEETLDLEGYLLLPAPADPHAHLDKARSFDAIRPPMGDLVQAIASWRTYAETITVDEIVGRARAQALAMLAKGTTAIRTHVDVLLGDEPLRGVQALVAVREELRDHLDIEIVALAGPDVPDEAIEAALDAGADVLGGSPHLAQDPRADLARLLAIAQRRGVPVDLHTDESLTGADTLIDFARAVRGWSQNVSAGHCVRLGMMPTDQRDATLVEVAASDLGIIANPITNLYLQGWGEGWEDGVAVPRGVTAARATLDAGVRFAAGADNVRDPFNPLGRSDALETAMLLVTTAHLSATEAYAAVSTGARSVLGLPAAGTDPGERADFLAIRAGSLVEAIGEASGQRRVIHAGRLVSSTDVVTQLPDSAGVPAMAAGAAT